MGAFTIHIYSYHTCRLGYARGSQPPLKFFFAITPHLKTSGYTWAQKPYPGTLFRPFRCIRQHLAIARCIQVYPGVSKKKIFRPKAGKIFF